MCKKYVVKIEVDLETIAKHISSLIEIYPDTSREQIITSLKFDLYTMGLSRLEIMPFSKKAMVLARKLFPELIKVTNMNTKIGVKI